MGKSRKAKEKPKRLHPHNAPKTKNILTGKLHHNQHASTKAKHTTHPAPPPTIPFSPDHTILLIGEGDFSFAASLASQYHCTSLTASTLLSAVDLANHHPSAAQHLDTLSAHSATLLYSIDATRLGLSGSPSGALFRSKRWDRIIFNFPHTGGLTKDVNRQVRANQELLVKFLGRAREMLAPGGQVVVTIFDGLPYELWGIRNLARHVGLKCGRSFRFDWTAYEGYRHARTLGEVKGGGGWRGEDRPARSYCFLREGDEMVLPEQEGEGMRVATSHNKEEDDDNDE